MGTFNLTTGQQVCIGTFNFMMVGFYHIRYPIQWQYIQSEKSGFESNQYLLTDYLSCSKGVASLMDLKVQTVTAPV